MIEISKIDGRISKNVSFSNTRPLTFHALRGQEMNLQYSNIEIHLRTMRMIPLNQQNHL
jgi:hypothetical protein